MRAVYFESNRSSEDGMLAVGTVVMNRVKSPAFPNTICGVVGQKNQFAQGVLSKSMRTSDLPKVQRIANEVLAGARHETVGKAMFFHTAGLRYPYSNMFYVALAGGNAFYEKRRNLRPPAEENPNEQPQTIEDLIMPVSGGSTKF
ncbi:spore germination cell wall hydrolase CwlJ-like protein [Rhodoligotrophos appendicifer]